VTLFEVAAFPTQATAFGRFASFSAKGSGDCDSLGNQSMVANGYVPDPRHAPGFLHC
jgi:hypothetical protein